MKRVKRLALALALSLLTTLPARGGSDRRNGRGPWPGSTWWRDRSTATALGLTPEQRQRLDERHAAGEEMDREGRAAIDRETARFDDLLTVEPLDSAALSRQIERVVAVRRLWGEALGRRLLAVREIVSAQQWRSLRDIPPEPTPRPERRSATTPLGRWWRQPSYAEALGLLVPDQDRLDHVYLDSRTRLGAARDSIRKVEEALRAALDAEPLDRGACLDRLSASAAAREEMDRAVFTLRVDVQKELTADQRRAFRKMKRAPAPPKVP